MHEMNHGIGGGTIDVWGGWNESFLRTSVNGDWAGERANAVLRFWENREDLVITAAYDGAHWGFRTLDGAYSQDNNWLNKYAFNGSHLEAGNWAGPQNWNDTQIVYIGNSLINQAMCEDGLVPVNYWSGGFCLPAYVFEQDDQKKYYIKCESAEHGLYDSFLTEGHSGKLTWKTMGSEEVSENDSAAWYVSFDAKTQYYTFCNAATKHLISYSNGFKTALRTNPSAADKFHLIRGRNDLEIGDYISYLVGADDVEKAKPNPEPVLKTLTATGFNASQTLVVGDMNVDILMGLNAGARTCGVTYGNGTRRELEDAGANYIIDSIDELTEIVK